MVFITSVTFILKRIDIIRITFKIPLNIIWPGSIIRSQKDELLIQTIDHIPFLSSAVWTKLSPFSKAGEENNF